MQLDYSKIRFKISAHIPLHEITLNCTVIGHVRYYPKFIQLLIHDSNTQSIPKLEHSCAIGNSRQLNIQANKNQSTQF